MDGLEVYHSSNKGEDVKIIQGYAEQYHLFQSGGSDFHGTVKPKVKLLTGEDNLCVPYEAIQEWTREMKKLMIE